MAALLDIVKKGSVDRSVTLRIIDNTDGTPETGVVFNTSGIDLWYRRESSAVVSITEVTLAALTTAHTDGGFLHISHGEYRLDLPDAAFATGANHVEIGGTVTGMVVIGGRVRLVNYDPEDPTRFGLTALPNAAAEALGGLYTRGTGAGQVNQPANGQVDANSVAISGDVAAADALEQAFDGTVGAVPALGIIDRGTAQSATATTLVLRAAAAFANDDIIGATIVITGGSTGVGQAKTITDYVSSTDTATVTAWNTTPTGTITYEMYGTPVSADLAPIQTDITTLLARVPAPVIGALVAGSNSATAHTTDLTETAPDHFKDAFLTYTSGILAKQTKRITAYNGTTKVLTTNAFTGTATIGDTFVIVNGR